MPYTLNTLDPNTELPRAIRRQRRLADAMSYEIMAPAEQTLLSGITTDMDGCELGAYSDSPESMFAIFHYMNPITEVHWDIAVRNDGKIVKVV